MNFIPLSISEFGSTRTEIRHLKIRNRITFQFDAPQ
jgi:hypothetical protein